MKKIIFKFLPFNLDIHTLAVMKKSFSLMIIKLLGMASGLVISIITTKTMKSANYFVLEGSTGFYVEENINEFVEAIPQNLENESLI